MNSNILGIKTLKYIWFHPNSQGQKIRSILRFLGWQIYKRVTKKYVDLQLLTDIKLRCHPDSRSASTVLYCGLYDYNEMNFLLRYLRDDDLFLDIGANIGVYTLLAASKIKQANIYSIEALPKNYARLEQNIKLNNFEEIKSFLLAVSNRTGKIELNLAEGDSMPYITSKASEKTISVNTQTLDSLLINRNINNFTLAKIDIEGAEILALEGAVSLLKQQRPRVWIMEINNTINNFGHSKQTIVDFLDKYGYKLYHYDATNNQLSCIDVDRQRDNNVLVIADNSINFVRDRLNI